MFDSSLYVDLCENGNEFVVIISSLNAKKEDIYAMILNLEILVIKSGWARRQKIKINVWSLLPMRARIRLYAEEYLFIGLSQA
jgi:hypothetical protein